MAVVTITFQFKRELAFGLEEKLDRITGHPALWSLKGQDVVYLPGEHLHRDQSEAPGNGTHPRFGSPFPCRQPRSVTGYFPPTPQRGSASLANGVHLPHGLTLIDLIPRVQAVTISWLFPALRATKPMDERKGIPDVLKRQGQGVTGGGVSG